MSAVFVCLGSGLRILIQFVSVYGFSFFLVSSSSASCQRSSFSSVLLIIRLSILLSLVQFFLVSVKFALVEGLNLRLWASGSWFWVRGLGFRALGFGFWVWGVGFRVSGSGNCSR